MFQDYLDIAKQKEQENLNFAQRFASDIPLINEIPLFKDEEAYNKQLIEIAKQEGVDEEALIGAARRRKTATTVGGAAAAVFINTYTEIGGRALMTKSFGSADDFISALSTSPIKSRAITFGNIASQGFIEGVGGYEAYRAGAEKEFKITDALIAGGTGALIAGSLGTYIATKSVSPSKIQQFKGSAVETVANILDPYEKVGDITAEGIMSLRVPVTTPSPTFTTTPQQEAEASYFFNAFTSTPGESIVVPQSVNIEGLSPVNTFTETTTQVNVPVNLETPTNINTFTQTEQPVQTFTQEFVSTPKEIVATQTEQFLPQNQLIMCARIPRVFHHNRQGVTEKCNLIL